MNKTKRVYARVSDETDRLLDMVVLNNPDLNKSKAIAALIDRGAHSLISGEGDESPLPNDLLDELIKRLDSIEQQMDSFTQVNETLVKAISSINGRFETLMEIIDIETGEDDAPVINGNGEVKGPWLSGAEQ